MSTQISLETSDKETFKVDKEVADRSVMLKNMLEGAFVVLVRHLVVEERI